MPFFEFYEGDGVPFVGSLTGYKPSKYTDPIKISTFCELRNRVVKTKDFCNCHTENRNSCQ